MALFNSTTQPNMTRISLSQTKEVNGGDTKFYERRQIVLICGFDFCLVSVHLLAFSLIKLHVLRDIFNFRVFS